MAKQPRRVRTQAELEQRRRLRHESRTSSTFKEFLRAVEKEAGLSEEKAEQAATAVLCALEQRIIRNEAEDLEAQLPRKLQFLLHACPRHEDLMPRDIRVEEFLQLVAGHLEMPHDQVEPIVRSVLKVVCQKVTAGEIEDVLSELPAELRGLFPADVVRRAEEERRQVRPRRVEAPEVGEERRGLIADIVTDLLKLPFDAQLGILRTIAPKIIHRLEANSREGFLRDLSEEIDRADRGEDTYDIRPSDQRH